MLNEDELDKLGFDLGMDFALYGIKPFDDARRSLHDGHACGLKRGSRKSIDIFTRKYLYLRYSALTRGRAVSEYVTPELIKYMCPKRCPITREPLTVRTLTDTDWSIDRVNNHGAYAPGNMVVMSVRANVAKGCKSAAEIGGVVEGLGDGERHEGLSAYEWRRLRWLAEKCDADADVPLVLVPPPLIVPSGFDLMQMLACYIALGGTAAEARKAYLKRNDKTLVKFAKAFSKYRGFIASRSALMDVMHVPVVFSRFRDFYDALPQDVKLAVLCSSASTEFCTQFLQPLPYTSLLFLRGIMRKLWLLDNHGFVGGGGSPLTDREALLFEKFLASEIALLGGGRHTDPFDPFKPR